MRKYITKPIIGITLDYKEEKTYSQYPWYALRQNYSSSLEEMGGIVLPITFAEENIADIVQIIDGLVITGGHFDISPELFINKKVEKHSTTKPNTTRTNYEIALLQKVLETNMPVLGICGGMQLINVVFGGSLIQDIETYTKTTIKHLQPNPRNEAGHKILIDEDTYLHKIAQTTQTEVNSAHHQAIDELGKNLLINAKAEDGIIEGIESTEYDFVLGTQWHPEFLISPVDYCIYQEFIKKSNEYKRRTKP